MPRSLPSDPRMLELQQPVLPGHGRQQHAFLLIPHPGPARGLVSLGNISLALAAFVCTPVRRGERDVPSRPHRFSCSFLLAWLGWLTLPRQPKLGENHSSGGKIKLVLTAVVLWLEVKLVLVIAGHQSDARAFLRLELREAVSDRD